MHVATVCLQGRESLPIVCSTWRCSEKEYITCENSASGWCDLGVSIGGGGIWDPCRFHRGGHHDLHNISCNEFSGVELCLAMIGAIV